MALSGSKTGGEGLYGINVKLEWSASQSQSGNYSNVTAKLYLEVPSGASVVATESGKIVIDGTTYSFSRGSTSRGAGKHLLHSATKKINHNSDGTKSFSASGQFVSGWSSLGTLNTGTGSWSLNTIDRYLSINSWNLNSPTEKSVNVYVDPAGTADLVDYSINGGAWQRGYTGNFTSKTFTIGGLNPATTYSIKIRVRNDSGGLYTETGAKSVTTQAVTITSLAIAAQTDTDVDINATVNKTADRMEYKRSTDSMWVVVAGDFTAKQFTIDGLDAETTYTYNFRARHKDSQQYTPVESITFTTGLPQPLQPDELAPNNALGVSTLEPVLSWRYNASSSDSPTAYQILIKRASDSVTVWDSGKISSDATTATVPSGAGLVFDELYQWQVKQWSGTDIEGPYSDLASFKTSEAPEVTITAPAADAILTTDSPTIEWTYSDPEATDQTAFRVRVERIGTSGDTEGTVVYENTVNSGVEAEATEFDLPVGTLANNAIYIVRVFATDSDGITGESDPVEFSVEFVSPQIPTLTVEVSEDTLFAQVTVESSKPENDAYETDFLRVYKREVGAIDWEFIGQIEAYNKLLDDMNDSELYTLGGTASDVVSNADSRQGAESNSFVVTGSGSATFTRADTGTGSIQEYTKQRIWIKPSSAVADFTAITFRFGTDSSNYYQFVVDADDLEDDVWNSIEVLHTDLTIVGSPTLADINWQRIIVDAVGAIADGDLLIDSWRAIVRNDSLFLLDYELANGKVYEYAATAYNISEGLESNFSAPSNQIVIEYDDFRNTYLIPMKDQSSAVMGFMDGKTPPQWSSNTDTQYLLPMGAKKPVVYVNGSQDYRVGNTVLRFFDTRFLGEGLEGAKKLEAIKNEKPIMFRTWWGEILYISIDGKVTTERLQALAWQGSFAWTEIEND